MVVDQPGDALGIAVRLFHQRHVVACACNTAEPHMRLTSPGPPGALGLRPGQAHGKGAGEQGAPEPE